MRDDRILAQCHRRSERPLSFASTWAAPPNTHSMKEPMLLFRSASDPRFGPDPSFDAALDDHELAAARDAAAAGDWQPAREVVRAAHGDWERRVHRVEVLGEFAAEDPDWLRAWLAAEPSGAEAAVVHAKAEVCRAWNARGGAWASQTSADAFRAFARILNDAEQAIDRAVHVAVDDPSPWITYLWLTIGRGEPWALFEQRWTELVARDPHNYLAHEARFQHSCLKWAGSHELMYDFCYRAAAAAPPGSPLAVLPLQAHFEWELKETALNPTAGALKATAMWAGEQVRRDIDTAVHQWLAPGQPSHALALKARSVLARAMTKARRHAEAAEHFTAIGPYVSEYPWYYENRGAERAFLEARKQAVRAAR